MCKRVIRGICYILLCMLLCGKIVWAAAPQQTVRVGISPFSPFVMMDETPPSGISLEIWQSIADALGIAYTLVPCTGVTDKLKKLNAGAIDVAIGGITITEARELQFDFTHPIYHTGLDILIPNQNEFTFFNLLATLFKGRKLMFFAGLLALIVIAGHVIWIVERSSAQKETRFHRNYFPGVFEGMYWALVTASTVGYGDKVPKRWTGRILTCILIIVFLPLFGFFIAQVSSDLTLHSIQTSIAGIEDLRGKRVGVVRGTTSFDTMKHEHTHLYAFQTIPEAYDALERGAIDAVVYDAPTLLHYANGPGKGEVKVVGKLFAPQDYGIALPQGSPLREPINRHILAAIESGEIDGILREWFGVNPRR